MVSLSTCPPVSLSPPPAHSFFIGPTVINIHSLLKEDEEFIMLRLIRIHHDRILPAGPG